MHCPLESTQELCDIDNIIVPILLELKHTELKNLLKTTQQISGMKT